MCEQNDLMENAGPTEPDYTPEDQKEKKRLKNTGSLIGFGVILYVLINILLYRLFDHFWYYTGLSSVLYDAKGNMNHSVELLQMGIFGILGLFLPFAFIAFRTEKSFSRWVPLKRVSAKKMAALVSVGLAVVTFADFFLKSLQTNLSGIGFELYLYEPSYGGNSLEIFLSIAVTAILLSVIEEFVFRGVILSMLRDFGDEFAILISGAVYALMFMGVVTTPVAFVWGAFWAYMVVYTNSIVPALLVHFFSNLLDVLIDVVSSYVSESAAQGIEGIALIAIFAAGLFAFIYLLRLDPKFLHVEPCNSVLPLKKRLKYVTLNTGMILMLGVMGFFIVMDFLASI